MNIEQLNNRKVVLSGNTKWKILVTIAVAAFILIVPLSRKAAANITLSPGPGTVPEGSLPDYVSKYLRECDYPYSTNYPGPATSSAHGQTPAFKAWVASAADPSNQSILVPAGTSSVALAFYYPAAVCFTVGKPGTYTNINDAYARDSQVSVISGDSSPGGPIAGLAGNGLSITGLDNTAGTYRSSSLGFTFAPPGGFTHTQSYAITIVSKNINHFINRFDKAEAWTCVGGSQAKTSAGGFSKCEAISTTYSITISVPSSGAVQTHTYKVDSSGNFIGGVPDVYLETCDNGGNNSEAINSPSKGYTSFQMQPGYGFCARITSTGDSPGSDSIPGYDGPFIRPWGEHYDSGNYNTGYFPFCNNGSGYGGPPYSGHCDQTTYEYQEAAAFGGWQNIGGGVFVYDRSIDTGYDFVYVKQGAPGSSLSCSGIPSTGSPGTLFSFFATGGGFPVWSAPSGLPTSGPPSPTFSTTFTALGPHTVTVTSGAQSATCSVTVAPPPPPPTNPYLRVYGGDVSAGGGFESSAGCSGGNPLAGILAYNQGVLGGGAGAGVQLAAFAANQIHEFSSAAMRNGAPAPNPVAGLTFSNTTPPGIAPYHGNFGAAACASDYSTGVIGNGYTNLTSWSTPRTVSAGGLSPHEIYRVPGDIVITGNITFSGTPATTQGLPSIYVISTGGNIYIGPGVTQLDGVYVAQGGTIYTCTNATNNGPPSQPVEWDNCKTNNLTVNGSFIAKTIKFLRVKGDVASATPNEGSSSNIAEVFNYTPELFLAPSPFTSSAPYQSVTNLPPVL